MTYFRHYQTRKVKMKKFVPAHSLKDDLRALHKSPGVPHRTEQELEVTSLLSLSLSLSAQSSTALGGVSR